MHTSTDLAEGKREPSQAGWGEMDRGRSCHTRHMTAQSALLWKRRRITTSFLYLKRKRNGGISRANIWTLTRPSSGEKNRCVSFLDFLCMHMHSVASTNIWAKKVYERQRVLFKGKGELNLNQEASWLCMLSILLPDSSNHGLKIRSQSCDHY